MAETITGNIEILYPEGSNQGVAGRSYTVDGVPIILEQVWGFSAITAVAPPRAGVVAEWTAMTPNQETVTVLLHQVAPFDLSLIGRVLMQQREES